MKAGLRSFFLLLTFLLGTLLPLPAGAEVHDVFILHTNDIHCGVEDNLGMAGLAGLKKELSASGSVLLADTGDAIQGTPLGSLSRGEAMVEIMNAVGYDFCVPGNHEFDYGMERFLELAARNGAGYYSVNLTDLRTGRPLLPPYKIIEAGGRRIAFIGVTTPDTLTSSTPTFFRDGEGRYIYGFCEDGSGRKLQRRVQKAVDRVRREGADYVILAAHLGISGSSPRYSSKALIENLTGVDAVLDGHSHERLPGWLVADKRGRRVILGQTGTKLQSIGKLTITADNRLLYELVGEASQADARTAAAVAAVRRPYEELLAQPVGEALTELRIDAPEDGRRLVRNQECSLGDFVADAYRAVLGADVAIVNGGGLRSNLRKGSFSYNDVLQVLPFGNICIVAEVTGRQLLDALETASAACPGESGAFLQVSGMTYTINTAIPSSVVRDIKGNFLRVGGAYRVGDVRINGQPLDPAARYKIAGPSYVLQNGGDGMSMLAAAPIVNNIAVSESDAFIEYVQNHLNGRIGREYANPYGSGRITVK